MNLIKGEILHHNRMNIFAKICDVSKAIIIDDIWGRVAYKRYRSEEFEYLEQGVKDNANENS